MKACEPAIRFLLMAAIFVSASSMGRAEEEESEPEPTPTPIYVPRDLGEPRGRIGAGSRDAGESLGLHPLAPDHVGLASRDQPVLYWYAEREIATRVELTLRDDRSTAPLVEIDLPLPISPGIHALPLASLSSEARLEPGIPYRWFVSIVRDPERRSKDVSAGAWIRYEPVPPAVAARLAGVSPDRRVFLYAENGYWYDAVDAVSVRIAAISGDAKARLWRAALLDQVGLDRAAGYDRASLRPGELGVSMRGVPARSAAHSQLLINRNGAQ